ncbi:unnamed protein product [Phaedon cochleariae]|uniref:Uncharacterized protein n=1 Tax=Phaedon cochleariae TaxID=80249 RepID=A0A9P0DPP2_PHACE|nr:unnamed protein product [Phaedon cochleariae]
MSSSIRTLIRTPNAPQFPSVPINQAIVFDNTIYCSGVIGVDKDTMKMVDSSFAAEVRQVMRNLSAILQAGNSSLENLLKVTVYLNDINDFATMNEVYREFITSNFPARTGFQVGKLPMNARVEIDAIAATGNVRTVIRE